MTATLAQIFRHPLKAIGRESLERVALTPSKTLPWDRAFAVAHERARLSDLEGPWGSKMNYLRGVTSPDLMAVTAAFEAKTQTLKLFHPRLDPFEAALDAADAERALLAWLDPLWPADLPRPTRLIHHEGHAQTDVPDPWIAINSLTAHRMVAQKLGLADLSIHRWRGNLWIDGLGPWEEFEWLGRNLRIGKTVLKVEARITRCKATMANPETGRRDADTLGALDDGWGHTDFGIYAEVVEGGVIQPGDAVEVV